jgi:hypothetical protein
MASIYNETMLWEYEHGGLYKSKNSSWGKEGYWSKNCSYGYAHYKPEIKEFLFTLGWRGAFILRKRFGVCMHEQEYFDFLKHYNLNYDWYITKFGNEKRKFYKEIIPYMMLIKI